MRGCLVSSLQNLQGRDAGDSKFSGSTERGWPLLEESPLAESYCSAHEHGQIVCLERKEFKAWGKKGAAAMWGSDEQGQQAKVLGLCEKREYIVSKAGLKQSHLKHLHVCKWLMASLPEKPTEPLCKSAGWDAFLKHLYMVETLRINMRS